MKTSAALVLLLFAACQPAPPTDTEPRKIEVLFLGHDSEHHNSEHYMPLLASALAKDGINLTYTSDPADLNPDRLRLFDALMLYANHDSITASQDKALLDFVASGKGFVPLHAASYCFRNSDDFVALVGAQFMEHGTDTFTVDIVAASHPVMQGLTPFETWDETYVHTRHNPDRTVLMERVDGDHREPWTWTRTHGKGRVFYTAYGHDERTWSHPGFHALVKNGLLWAVGDDLRSRWEQLALPTLTYSESDRIPNYERRDPPPKLQAPLSPEASQQLIQVPPGFELQLFASEPDIKTPIAGAWDEKGRLWLIETPDYPNQVRPSGIGNDVITILEDTDGDGKADVFKTFADSLNIPTSLVFANGGVIVAQAPHFLFLKDTDGDDVADVREVLFTGWGVDDTHAGPSNLRYGMDNWVWGTVGYSAFEGTIGGEEHAFAMGVYRIRPDGTDLDFISPFTNNTWGLGFSETFDVFGSTANNEHALYVAIPDRYYEGVAGLRGNGKKKIDGHYAIHPITQNVRQVDVFGGFTAAAGISPYTARSFPREYWNRIAFISEPTGHLLHRAILEKEGAGFAEKDGWNMLASADEWVSPVWAEVGPDGALWVLDWYNFIVQHNPTPAGFDTGEGNAHINPHRDKTHGRIYRLAYKDAPTYQPLTLSPDDPDGLLDALDHDNMFWRMTAQRLLVERGEMDVLAGLYKQVKNKRMDEIGISGGAMHALWVLHGLGALEGSNIEAVEVARAALRHPAAGVRKAALQVLPRTEETLQALLDADVLNDADLHTRFAALLAVSEMPTSEAVGVALYAVSQRPDVINDEWLPEAVFIAANAHQQAFFDAYAADIGPTEFAMRAARYARGEGNVLREWSSPSFDAADWDTMQVPQAWSENELAAFDGTVWFRTEVDLPAALGQQPGRLLLGPIDDSDVTWINGMLVGETDNLWWQRRDYAVPADVFIAGRNVLAIRVEDTAGTGNGGIWGDPEMLYLAIGNQRIPLAGRWKYKKELTFTSTKATEIRTDAPIADQFLMHNAQAIVPDVAVDAPSEGGEVSGEPAQQRSLSVIVGELTYDQTVITVQAGQSVALAFSNPDDMQHNVLILRPGTTEAVGTLADAMLSDTDAADRHYVPDTDDVLFATDLVNPRASTTLTFIAPTAPGDYPFICTFPGHWRTMQGILRVE